MALEVVWQQQLHGEVLRPESMQALLLARRHHAGAWISDADRAGTMLYSLQHDVGITRFALLESADAHNRALLRPHVARYSAPTAPIALRRFTDREQARAWALG